MLQGSRWCRTPLCARAAHQLHTPHLVRCPSAVRAMEPVTAWVAEDAQLLALQSALKGGDIERLLTSQGGTLTCASSASTPQQGSDFCPRLFFNSLRTEQLGRTLLTSRRTSSTQSVLQETLRGVPNGLVFVADRQMSGKGRGSNVWESPEGCLMVSAVMNMTIAGQRLPFFQYLVSMAVVEAIKQEAARCLQVAEGVDLGVRLKWPNDIYVGAKKIGGVLCHSAYRAGAFQLLWGLGLNVANAAPSTCVSMLLEAAARPGGPPPLPPRRETLLASLLNWLEAGAARLAEQGFDGLRPAYLDAWLHTDQAVELEEGGVRVPLVIRGLTRDGYLLAEDGVGGNYELHPDGNSLDFFKGLVRRKLPITH